MGLQTFQSTGECDKGRGSKRVEPWCGSPDCGGGTRAAFPRWKLRALHVCTENSSTKKEEACVEEEDEEGKAQARGFCTWRVVGKQE